MSAGRDLDVVLFGATSFVGRLTAQYLARAAPPQARVGLSGRSIERLRDVQASLGAPAAEWPLLVADSDDRASLQQLAAAASVLTTTVGPYRRYGMPVLEACATAGTHYADLTGEVLFMREAIDRFDGVAASSGARIVHGCGFDSIPSDLGVLLLHEAARVDGAGELEDTTLVVRALKGGPSGGTVASLKGTIDDARRDSALARVLADPYALSPDRAAEPRMGDESDLRGVRRDSELGQWQAPFIMGSINTRVVRRSNALQGYAYGTRFRYREVTGVGSGPLAALQAGALAAGVGALTGGLAIGPVRAVLDRVLPAPGEGPGERQRERGFFRIEIHTHTSSGARYVCRVAARGDPGYKATAVMLGESALCLALDGDRLARVGVLTPATAMGDVLVERLRRAGQTFEVKRLG
ncbi:MAG TPA: saccharopine dehydrogenase NADP-binding domain-containing protein [Solirubrobacteraceae bacterium]|nr:saccharopine dehydrogenase NADP-binding domain-containing protein [Solirubrobacteraceae bacterium]